MSCDAGLPSQENVGLVANPSTASDPKHSSGKHGNAASTAQDLCSSSPHSAQQKVMHSSPLAFNVTPLMSSSSTPASNAPPRVASAALWVPTFTPLPSHPHPSAVTSTPLASSMTPQGVASSLTAERVSEAGQHPSVAAVEEVCLPAQLKHATG